MQINQLAGEYRVTADRLQERLNELRAQLPVSRGEETFRIQRRMEALLAELRDVRIVMGYLNSYYN